MRTTRTWRAISSTTARLATSDRLRPIGGIGPAKWVAEYAAARGVTYVNHTFTSHLALSASLQPYRGPGGPRDLRIPAAPKPVVEAYMASRIQRDAKGDIRAPDAPGSVSRSIMLACASTCSTSRSRSEATSSTELPRF